MKNCWKVVDSQRNVYISSKDEMWVLLIRFIISFLFYITFNIPSVSRGRVLSPLYYTYTHAFVGLLSLVHIYKLKYGAMYSVLCNFTSWNCIFYVWRERNKCTLIFVEKWFSYVSNPYLQDITSSIRPSSINLNKLLLPITSLRHKDVFIRLVN